MLNNNNNNPNISTNHVSHENQEDEQITEIREIHALTPPRLPPPLPPTNRGGSSHSHRSSSLSTASTDSENFTTISREFNALVLAGSTIDHNNTSPHEYETSNNNNLGRIREDDHMMEETNPLAIVVDNNPLDPVPSSASRGNMDGGGRSEEHVSVDRVKKQEVDAKISAWQNAKVAKINNRFKREDAVINGWESEQVQKATSWMKKVERKLEEKRARALEKTQNKVAKAHRKAEERKASAEAKRGTKVARVLEIANLMRAVGRPPAKKSFF
ncbi:remorin 4.2 [Trifolium repens]|nr:remorin 4.2 [Trifolium repens]